MRLFVRFAVRIVRLYQICLSPWMGRECRFIPTCSAYAIESYEKHGFLKGTYLTVMRIARCHPFGGRGYDPVPETFCWRCWSAAAEEHRGPGRPQPSRTE